MGFILFTYELNSLHKKYGSQISTIVSIYNLQFGLELYSETEVLFTYLENIIRPGNNAHIFETEWK